MGMAQTKLVKEFIKNNLDSMFGERLKQGFVNKYENLAKKEKLKGDVLFDSLLEFSSMSNSDFKQKAAGLAILSYFFESCDVFEA